MNTAATIRGGAAITGQVRAVGFNESAATEKVKVEAHIDQKRKISASMNGEHTVIGTVGYARPGSDRPIYHGDTTVVPEPVDIGLSTAGKVVLQDITVKAIPMTQVANEFGITINIGG